MKDSDTTWFRIIVIAELAAIIGLLFRISDLLGG